MQHPFAAAERRQGRFPPAGKTHQAAIRNSWRPNASSGKYIEKHRGLEAKECSQRAQRLLAEARSFILAAVLLARGASAVAPTAPLRPPPPPPLSYPYPPRIHWAQGCLEGKSTHDISGGIILTDPQTNDTAYHAWIGCFHAETGGGWQHVHSSDLTGWKRGTSFTGAALTPDCMKAGLCHIEAGAVGIDQEGRAYAVEVLPGARAPKGSPPVAKVNVPQPYHLWRFTNSSSEAWETARVLFNVTSNRVLPGDPPRPWLDQRDGKWYALVSFNDCNASMLQHRSYAGKCPGGGAAMMWSSPALYGPAADWKQTPEPLLATNHTVLDGTNGLPNRPSHSEFVTSDFFPVSSHPRVNAVFVTSRYGKGNSSSEPSGLWNYLVAYVGFQQNPGGPMTVHQRVALDWGCFVRTSGWHGIDAATDAGTMFGIGKSMRGRDGSDDDGRRVLLAWMTNGYWDGDSPPPGGWGRHAAPGARGLPKDALSLPRDISFNPTTGRLEQRYVPELRRLRIASDHEHLTYTVLSPGRLLWMNTHGRQLEVLATFELPASTRNISFGLHVLASSSLVEYTTIGIDLGDDLAYVDRRMSSGRNPLVYDVLDVRAGVLPPAIRTSLKSKRRILDVHAIIDGCILTLIVGNETAISTYVYPQRNASSGLAIWADGQGVRARADAWLLKPVFPVASS